MMGATWSRRLLWALAIPAAAAVTGCTSYRVETGPVARVMAEREPRSLLLTLSSDREVEMFGPIVDRDSLRGHPRPESVQRVSYAIADIRTIKTRHFNLGKSLLYVAFAAGGVVVYDILMSANGATP